MVPVLGRGPSRARRRDTRGPVVDRRPGASRGRAAPPPLPRRRHRQRGGLAAGRAPRRRHHAGPVGLHGVSLPRRRVVVVVRRPASRGDEPRPARPAGARRRRRDRCRPGGRPHPRRRVGRRVARGDPVGPRRPAADAARRPRDRHLPPAPGRRLAVPRGPAGARRRQPRHGRRTRHHRTRPHPLEDRPCRVGRNADHGRPHRRLDPRAVRGRHRRRRLTGHREHRRHLHAHPWRCRSRRHVARRATGGDTAGDPARDRSAWAAHRGPVPEAPRAGVAAAAGGDESRTAARTTRRS